MPEEFNERRNNMGVTYVHESQEDDCWEVEVDTVEQCSKAPNEVKVYLTPLVKAKINALMDKFQNIEWFSYLIGEKTDDNFLVEDLLIPKQTVTSSSVTNVQCPDFNHHKIIGAMHSHHHMGTGFSHTDDTWVNQNHDISLVVATNGIAGQVRWKTPCGGLMIVPAKVLPYINIDFDKESFYKTELGKISAPSATSGGEHCTVGRAGGRVFPSLHHRPCFPNQTVTEENEDTSLLTALEEAYPTLHQED